MRLSIRSVTVNVLRVIAALAGCSVVLNEDLQQMDRDTALLVDLTQHSGHLATVSGRNPRVAHKIRRTAWRVRGVLRAAPFNRPQS